jgi:hypothetical protein
VSETYRLRRCQTQSEIAGGFFHGAGQLIQNRIAFAGTMADSSNLRTPLLTARFPVYYLAEPRALNSRSSPLGGDLLAGPAVKTIEVARKRPRRGRLCR